MHVVKDFMEAMQAMNTTWDILDSIGEIDDVDETTTAVDDDEMEGFSD
jgi:hypothetical protein